MVAALERGAGHVPDVLAASAGCCSGANLEYRNPNAIKPRGSDNQRTAIREPYADPGSFAGQWSQGCGVAAGVAVTACARAGQARPRLPITGVGRTGVDSWEHVMCISHTLRKVTKASRGWPATPKNGQAK